MACFINVMAISLVVVGTLVSCQKELDIDRDDNIEPFALLCRIYNVVKNPPINYVDLQEPVEIVKEIDALNTSLVEPNFLNETEQLGNSWEPKLNSAAIKGTAISKASLNQIAQSAHTILEEIKKMNITENIEKAKAYFSQVIFGDGGNESNLCHTTVKDMDNRSVACGIPGEERKGDRAGKNLVVDFFCLCAMRTESSEGAKQACGFFVGKIDKYYGWSEQGPWGSSTMWASIKGGCGKHMHQRPKSTTEARHILDQFLKHLKTGGVYRSVDSGGKTVEYSDRKAGMLGTGVGKENVNGKDILCNGKKGGKDQTPGGVCVYYGQDPNSWEGNILWLKLFQTALAIVDAANNQTAFIQRALQKLQLLQHRAEYIYETMKVVGEIQNTERPPPSQSASGNLTAYNATRTRSYSYSHHPYLMPLWVLLLL
ncbi:Variant surface glycoprotein [Trypanosoma congolense IL3000]|uniref:Variant surface glycoprotein n=1 Tax=Trypanosoma congolense (strain IL3000) TaxID=1068625 RepID=F9W4E2_TRYCI|nr:Variant surface glycoprotein [Trypanosoma congolense IL3000]